METRSPVKTILPRERVALINAVIAIGYAYSAESCTIRQVGAICTIASNPASSGVMSLDSAIHNPYDRHPLVSRNLFLGGDRNG